MSCMCVVRDKTTLTCLQTGTSHKLGNMPEITVGIYKQTTNKLHLPKYYAKSQQWRMFFGQYQASSAALEWLGDGATISGILPNVWSVPVCRQVSVILSLTAHIHDMHSNYLLHVSKWLRLIFLLLCMWSVLYVTGNVLCLYHACT